MGFKSATEGIPAAIYLGLYAVYLLITLYVIRKIGWKTRFTFLFVFSVMRVGGQFCGLMFSILGYDHYQWLIAYLVLTAEGYFTLVLTTFHLIATSQVKVYGTSWIRPTLAEIKARHPDVGRLRLDIIRMGTLSAQFHTILIPANALLIAGGSMLTGITGSNLTGDVHGKLITSKSLRCVGQVIFLIQTVFCVGMATYVFVKERVRIYAMRALFFSFPFLVVRGIFGVMSIFVTKMNYYDLSNYDENGLSTYFVTCEYTMATTMEFCAACILLSIYFHDSRYEQDAEMQPSTDKESELMELK